MTSIHMYDPRYWEPKFEYKSVFFKECAVTGISFHVEANDEIWQELHEGVDIALVRDKNNKHDCNAVAVALADDYDGDPDDFDFSLIIGYIPRTKNEELAHMLDAGFGNNITAKITTYKNSGNVNARIRITIYLESLTPTLVRPYLLRAKTINLDELRDINTQLNNNGTVYMRFGGFYDRNIVSPIEGEKVIAVCDNDKESVILYLLHILATGNKCAEYVNDPDILDMVDDCCPYILTNVCGPVLINRNDYSFLSELDISDLDPMEYLNENLSIGFERLFDNILFRPLNRNNIDMDPSIDNLK